MLVTTKDFLLSTLNVTGMTQNREVGSFEVSSFRVTPLISLRPSETPNWLSSLSLFKAKNLRLQVLTLELCRKIEGSTQDLHLCKQFWKWPKDSRIGPLPVNGTEEATSKIIRTVETHLWTKPLLRVTINGKDTTNMEKGEKQTIP